MHQAFTLCHMFCGWQLLHDYKTKTELENGIIEINVLTSEYLHDGKLIKPLNMAFILNSWMTDGLNTNNIPISSIGPHSRVHPARASGRYVRLKLKRLLECVRLCR